MLSEKNEKTRLVNHGQVPILVYEGLEEAGIYHGTTTRKGGVSLGPYSSLNLGYSTGDSKEAVTRNYHILAEALGIDLGGFTLAQQTHTANIRIISQGDKGKGLTQPSDYRDVDGLITNAPGITLCVFHADCVPMLFYDPRTQTVAAAHAGWRGTAANIAGKMVNIFKQEFQSRPQDIRAVTGPAIGQCCYEVDAEVRDKFEWIANSSEFIRPGKPGKFYLDLALANRRILLSAGLSGENIQVSGICTACHNSLFFSHRKQDKKRGVQVSFIGLKN